MAFNWLIIAGHGDGDVGAQGKVGKYAGVLECDKTRELAALIQKETEATYANVNAYVYPTDRNAYKDCQQGIFKQILWQYFPGVTFDYVLELHFNAFNISAHGTECFVIPEEKGISVEQFIMKRMGTHFTLRDNDNIFDGVKRTRFLVINTVKQQLGISGALLEVCFIDNVADMDTYEAKKYIIAKDIPAGAAEGWGWIEKSGAVHSKPSTDTTTKVPVANQGTEYAKGDVVTLLNKKDIIYYGADYGKKIPDGRKGKTYTVQQVSSDGKYLLLKEITSWVAIADCTKNTATTTTKPTTTTKKQKLYLPKTANHWNVYPLNKAPVVGNQCGALNPSLFGGLTYDILAYPQSNVVTIQTRDFGKVNIYVGSETGAIIK